MRDPGDRRFGHPFVNCTNCGPRFTIVTDVPYDRVATTMAGFPMCDACRREYHDPADRRFHAQPVCCPSCGPTLRFVPTGSLPDRAAATDVVAAAALSAGAAALRAGAVLAIKGLGGYHLAALASDEAAVAALRARKHREDKPFAVLAPDVDAARALCALDAAEEAELTSRRAPIVLLRRRSGAPVAAAVAPGHSHLGLLLPYTPVHHLLLDELPAPLVLTSGNVSDEPIAHRDDDAVERLAGIADAFLTHDRAIRTRADDSVLRVVRGRTYPVRRSRGYTPEPIRLAVGADRPVLGCGAELKNTFCLLRGSRGVPVAPRRRPRERRDPARLHRRDRAPGSVARRRARRGGTRPAPGVPVDEVGAGAGRASSSSASSTTTRTWRRAWPSTASRTRRSASRVTAWATGPTVCCGAARSWTSR